MKRFFILAAMLLVTISSFAQDGKSIYQKYSDSENISAVYVSPAMFKMIGKLPDIELNDGEVSILIFGFSARAVYYTTYLLTNPVLHLPAKIHMLF